MFVKPVGVRRAACPSPKERVERGKRSPSLGTGTHVVLVPRPTTTAWNGTSGVTRSPSSGGRLAPGALVFLPVPDGQPASSWPDATSGLAECDHHARARPRCTHCARTYSWGNNRLPLFATPAWPHGRAAPRAGNPSLRDREEGTSAEIVVSLLSAHEVHCTLRKSGRCPHFGLGSAGVVVSPGAGRDEARAQAILGRRDRTREGRVRANQPLKPNVQLKRKASKGRKPAK